MLKALPYCGFCKKALFGGYATNMHGFYYHPDCWFDYEETRQYKRSLKRRRLLRNDA